MNLVAIVLIVIGVWVAVKAAGALLKLAFWGVALAGIYWFLAPAMGWPLLF
jgi:hypothetical protein